MYEDNEVNDEDDNASISMVICEEVTDESKILQEIRSFEDVIPSDNNMSSTVVSNDKCVKRDEKLYNIEVIEMFDSDVASYWEVSE